VIGEDMSKKTLGIILIVAGTLIIAFSLGADLIGFGHYPGINWAQYSGAAIGLIFLGIGIWSVCRKEK
jgi:hypothetical protein